MLLFRIFVFHFANKKTNMGIADHIFIFRFMIIDLEKGKTYLFTLFLFLDEYFFYMDLSGKVYLFMIMVPLPSGQSVSSNLRRQRYDIGSWKQLNICVLCKQSCAAKLHQITEKVQG